MRPRKDAELASSALTRRASLAGAGAGLLGAAAGAALRAPAAADAAVLGLYAIVVDVAGTGDYTSLEAAVAAAPTDCTIFVKRGLYTIQGGNMRPPGGVRIVGEGYGTHIRARDGMNANLFLLEHDNCAIENLRIDGNGSNQALASGNCVYLDGVKGARVMGCWVEQSPGYNIVAFPGTTHAVIDGNHVSSSRKEGIELQGASYCSVTGNAVWDAGFNGILLWNSTGDCANNAVTGNTVSGSGGFGISASEGAHDNTITGNTAVSNAQHGILVDDAGPHAIVGNVARSNGTSGAGTGIRVQGTSNCLISGNLVSDNNGPGILVNGAHATVVASNNVFANSQTGIMLSAAYPGPVWGSVVEGNVSSGNGRDTTQSNRSGISIRGPFVGTVIAHNRCFDPSSPPTQLFGFVTVDDGPKNLVVGPNAFDGNAQGGQSLASGGNVAAVAYRIVSATVGTSQVAVPHGLPYAPRTMSITMTSPGSVWRSSASDATNVYLRADAPGRTAEVTLG